MPSPSENSLKPPPDLAILNASHLDSLLPSSLPSSQEVILELIELFEKENGERLKIWKNICNKHNTDELIKEAHYLAGSSLNLGLQRLGTLCQNIETAIKNNTFTAFDSCYTIVIKEFYDGIQELRKYAKQRS